MTNKTTEKPCCAICNQLFQRSDLISGEIIGKEMAQEICKTDPRGHQAYICRADLAKIRGAYVHSILESERGELSSLEQEVIRFVRARNIDQHRREL